MILITPAQCRAARALLDWSQPDLAERCGMHVQTISAFESDSGSPTKTTLQKITQVLGQGGIELLPNNGVAITKNKIYTATDYCDVLRDALGTLKEGDEILFIRAHDNVTTGPEGDLLSQIAAKGIRMRALTTPKNDQKRPDRDYRYLPEKFFNAIQLQLVYGDKFVMHVDHKGSDYNFVTIKNATLVDTVRRQFEYWWDISPKS